MRKIGNENNLTQDEAKKQLDLDKDIFLLDVREVTEYRERHIKNSVNIPQKLVKSQIGNYVKNKDTTIFVYCLSGGRSESSAKELKSLGYTNVFNIGGISSWKYGTI